MYEPDDLTETRMELLAAVSTDSDLYLDKVLDILFLTFDIWTNGPLCTLYLDEACLACL